VLNWSELRPTPESWPVFDVRMGLEKGEGGFGNHTFRHFVQRGTGIYCTLEPGLSVRDCITSLEIGNWLQLNSLAQVLVLLLCPSSLLTEKRIVSSPEPHSALVAVFPDVVRC
jgi:hypothetical protein